MAKQGLCHGDPFTTKPKLKSAHQSKDICVELEEIPSFLKYCVQEYSTDKLTT